MPGHEAKTFCTFVAHVCEHYQCRNMRNERTPLICQLGSVKVPFQKLLMPFPMGFFPFTLFFPLCPPLIFALLIRPHFQPPHPLVLLLFCFICLLKRHRAHTTYSIWSLTHSCLSLFLLSQVLQEVMLTGQRGDRYSQGIEQL